MRRSRTQPSRTSRLFHYTCSLVPDRSYSLEWPRRDRHPCFLCFLKQPLAQCWQRPFYDNFCQRQKQVILQSFSRKPPSGNPSTPSNLHILTGTTHNDPRRNSNEKMQPLRPSRRRTTELLSHLRKQAERSVTALGINLRFVEQASEFPVSSFLGMTEGRISPHGMRHHRVVEIRLDPEFDQCLQVTASRVSSEECLPRLRSNSKRIV